MSQYFDMDGETLWNPSNGVSRLFLRHVALAEDELGIPSGIGPMVNDECQIARATLQIFVNALLAQHRRTSHAVLLALSEGFTATMLALAERAGIKVDWALLDATGDVQDVQVSPRTGMTAPPEDGAWAARIRERSRELGRFMSR